MKISKIGLHFERRNAFWKDLFFLISYRKYDLKEHWKRRGPKLFFKQCWLSLKDWIQSCE